MLLFCNEDKEQMIDNYCPPSILYYPLLSSIIFFLLEKKDLAKVEVFIYLYMYVACQTVIFSMLR